MICFICKDNISSMYAFIAHLKKRHDLSTYSTFRCMESNCKQSFQNLGSFKKHLTRKHFLTQPTQPINGTSSSYQENINQNIIFESNATLNCFQECSDNCESKIPEVKKFNVENSLNELFTSATGFVLKLHNNNSFSRKNIIEIQEGIQNFILNPIVELLKSFSNEYFANKNIEVHNVFLSLISKCRNPFYYCNTEYKLFNWLQNNNFLESINEFSVNNEINAVYRDGNLTYDEDNTKGVLMPLKFQFQKFFESGDIFKNTILHMQNLSEENKISSFIQGDLWKQKSSLYPGKIIIPYFLYSDDFEINNPLSSHAGVHSICNIYYSFPCLPWKESKLDNIFLAGIIKSKDLKSFGNEKCFQTLIQELKSLEVDGVDITINGQNKKKFILFWELC
ncbi:uncharacterized protein LOC129907702 isoform X1 [Episyrphus balteatus]|uniref:uncharacterized protein LOC129907702 isoform X1 n=1 Tax=Episyrphus balteatus TaxID=286459 RepID=UPI002484DBC7|nr:uncharacterized protein LOC129907702 isoform X1 [Episyrphus balteatus]XP_055840003.1 uncharacterized protein LOC129907702 isoform X1 [Episyrphus balteatus]XP_055840004.1 uncharacterized protein LOC129907702 isoform X1 [Episyrphus balteatus]